MSVAVGTSCDEVKQPDGCYPVALQKVERDLFVERMASLGISACRKKGRPSHPREEEDLRVENIVTANGEVAGEEHVIINKQQIREIYG
jgi:hypothetical protein